MRKPILFVLLAVAGIFAFGETAHARNRRACYGYSGWSAPTIAAPMTAVPMTTTTQDGTVVSQSTPQNNASTYQSNSFEPSSPEAITTTTNSAQTVIAPVVQYSGTRYSAPMLQRSNSYEYNHVLRGDKKARGIGL